MEQVPEYAKLINLAAGKMGAKCLYATDDFFAEKENLLKPGRGIFIPDKYTENGKWMDGWESRRKRVSGHDWCIIRLAVPGQIEGFDIDTNHFLGNHPPHASIEACYLEDDILVNKMNEPDFEWTEILGKSALDPGSQHYYACKSEKTWTHVRLHIYPDGGVARLKVYGNVYKDWSKHPEGRLIDLAAAVNGARAVTCNDMFFSHKDNLLMPGKGINMGDGWETKRNRTPNNRDWLIVQLAHPGNIHAVMVDTHHFKGNYPDTCSIEGAILKEGTDCEDASIQWETILPKVKLSAHNEHMFEKEITSKSVYTHVRFNIFPDGGVSRLRLYGKPKLKA